MDSNPNSYMLSRGFAANTSIWLIELARNLPPSAQLDGLDINFGQCPPKEWLPSNISWVTHDVLSEPPSELLEKYDIIHVQLFITILRDGNPVPMLRNLMKMLSEFTINGSCMEQKDPDGNYLINNNWQSQEAIYPGENGTWITRLPETFKENGFENVVVDRHKFSQEIVTLLLDTWMMASQEISVNVLDRLGGGQGDVARGLIEEVGKNRQNTAFNLQRVITIGQKPAA
ncbi:MAG: hypothetical protein Q9187_001038 [Circinaria calcarea]